MGLLSFFKRSAANQPAPASAPESIEQARTRARHRLIGAAVLVVIGVIGRQLPIQDLLGFVSQATVLCAVARELGVTDQRTQVRMLAAVLCDRDLSVVVYDGDSSRPLAAIPRSPSNAGL